MLDRNVVGLDWSTFFIAKNEKPEKQKKELLEKLKHFDGNEEFYDNRVLRLELQNFDSADEYSQVALERVLCKFLVQDTTFAFDVLSEEDYLKAQELVSRKQYNSKILKQIIAKFNFLLRGNVKSGKLCDVLMLDFNREKSIVYDEKVVKTFAELKLIIEKIASGIKSVCYLKAKAFRPSFNLDDKSNAFVEEKYSYDFNKIARNNSLFLWDHEGKRLNDIFKYKLLPNEKFWEKHDDFCMAKFIENVREYNSSAHANKILSYIFDEIKKDTFAQKLIENNLSLIYLEKEPFVNQLEERTFNFSFGRFGVKDQFGDLAYPLTKSDDFENKLKLGKEIFNKIFYDDIYSHQKEVVKNFFENEVFNPNCIIEGQKWTILDFLDSFTFGYHNTEDKQVTELICQDYFSAENVLNRAYIKAYYLSKMSMEDLSHNFFEVFFDLTQAIEKRTGIKTTYQIDIASRERTFEGIKTILSKYKIIPSETFKNDYIIALLDRKVARFEEAERFPVLEQLGDSIYNFAVAELLFYNPFYNEDNCNYYELCKLFVSAEKQVEICKNLGVDKLYLKSSTFAHKYEYDKLIDADSERFSMEQIRESFSFKEKYLADSLEMIIGVICLQYGVQKALDFAKELIISTFPKDFAKEVKRCGGGSISQLFTSYDLGGDAKFIERDYLTKILPALYGEMGNGHRLINDALVKLLLTLCLGTDSVDVRNYITNNYSDSVVDDDRAGFRDINECLHDYFYNGLEFVIEKYKEEIQKKYKNK